MSPARAGQVTEVVVVVPARDEELLLGRCLRSIGRARAVLRARHPYVRSRTVVVLDGCRDGTAGVAARHDCDTVEIQVGCVGAARAEGVRRARPAAAEAPAHRVWVASTDADSEVPPGWLVAQVSAAEAGAGLVLGAVRPVGSGTPSTSLATWHRLDDAQDPRDRVHGANLGVRLACYDRAGGFAAVPEHEDVLLVSALRRLGVAEATAPPVRTSARLAGRSPGGFAGFLRNLEADDSAPEHRATGGAPGPRLGA